MPTKHGRKTLPPGLNAGDFRYCGRPAKDQGDFGADVGIADMVCCKQFGQNNDKFYHAGVVTANGRFFAYTEWGRRTASRSWDGSFIGQDFMFIECSSESEARSEFAKICHGKNTKRITKNANGIWVSKGNDDGYFVQSLATRVTGLPAAYVVKDDEGIAAVKAVPAPTEKPKRGAKKTAAKVVSSTGFSFHPAEIKLHADLIGGMAEFTKTAAKAAGGVLPTLSAIKEVRDLLPAAMGHIARIGKTVRDGADFDRRLALACTKDRDLQELSLYVASRVPRPVASRNASPDERALATILSSANILSLQGDLDVFQGSLEAEDFALADTSAVKTLDLDKAFNAQVRYLDLNGDRGRWVADTYLSMSRNRHSHLRGQAKILNIFEIVRPDRDLRFENSLKAIAAKRKGMDFKGVKADLQPRTRPDISDLNLYNAANAFLGIHGTRAVNIAPILGSNFRLPKSLPGAQITGAAFGHGVYFADDWRKSHGYTGHGNSYWATGGTIRGRGFFMCLCDVALGNPYMTTTTGSWSEPPRGYDSIFADCRRASVQNNEYIIFNPDYQRIRYVIEGTI